MRLTTIFLKFFLFQSRKFTPFVMADEDLLDYDEEQAEETPVAAVDEKKKDGKGPGYVSIHSSGFRDFLLKPELLRAIVDCGFEHPSQVKKNAA